MINIKNLMSINNIPDNTTYNKLTEDYLKFQGDVIKYLSKYSDFINGITVTNIKGSWSIQCSFDGQEIKKIQEQI